MAALALVAGEPTSLFRELIGENGLDRGVMAAYAQARSWLWIIWVSPLITNRSYAMAVASVLAVAISRLAPGAIAMLARGVLYRAPIVA